MNSIFQIIPIAKAAPLTTVNPGSKTLGDVAGAILGNVLAILGGIAMIFVIYGGILYMTSQGDPAKVEKAKKTLMWAVIGIILIALSYGIVVSLNQVIKGFI
jgi:amino acid transporter